ncbi:MAG: hypothetical protein AAFR96_02905 [Planctomycetota bacterium]
MSGPDLPILPLIARSGLSEADVLAFIEGELPGDHSAEIVGVLASHPELSEQVFAMRGDRGELSNELGLIGLPGDPVFARASVARGVTGELDADLAHLIESTGSGERVAQGVRTSIRRVPTHRRLRLVSARGVGGVLAACLLAGMSALLYSVWPSSPAAPASTGAGATTHGGRADGSPAGPASASAERIDASTGEPLFALANDDAADLVPPGWTAGDATAISTPAEALAAAEQGRLLIRVFSPHPSVGRGLIETITTTPSVSRVAVLLGEAEGIEASSALAAVPVTLGPVFAGDASLRELASEASASASASGVGGRASSWVYLLEIEPTERGFSLLMSGLSRDRGALVQLWRSDRPLTTPGSVDGVLSFEGPPRRWSRRVAAPVVVQSSSD